MKKTLPPLTASSNTSVPIVYAILQKESKNNYYNFALNSYSC